MSLFHLLACNGWAWSKQGLKNGHNVILFLEVLLDWVNTKSKVWSIPEKINIMQWIVSDNFWQCVAETTLMKESAKHLQFTIRCCPLFSDCEARRKVMAVTSSVNRTFSSSGVISTFKKPKTDHSENNICTQNTSTDTAAPD